MSRLLTSLFCSLAIPTLLIWAYIRWTRGIRRELPHWRNGAGLASITIISVCWLYEVLAWIHSLSGLNLTSFYAFVWYAEYIELYLILPAPWLALALKGLPRVQVLTAGILLNVLIVSFVYA
jgi:hypothetical protein